MTFPEFWHRADVLPRASLVTAGAALLINISTYFGLAATGWATSLYLMHLVVIVLGFWAFGRRAGHTYESIRDRPLERAPVGVPWQLVLGTVVSCLYLLGVAVSSEPENESGLLRVFSAAWLFFALLTAVDGFYIAERRRPMRRASGVAG